VDRNGGDGDGEDGVWDIPCRNAHRVPTRAGVGYVWFTLDSTVLISATMNPGGVLRASLLLALLRSRIVEKISYWPEDDDDLGRGQ
jgi:hypothetical protein